MKSFICAQMVRVSHLFYKMLMHETLHKSTKNNKTQESNKYLAFYIHEKQKNKNMNLVFLF